MSLRIIDCQQGEHEWFAARRGIPTASEFATVMASGRGGGESITRRKYLHQLVGERLTPPDTDEERWSNRYTERGHLLEPVARNLYALLHDVEPVQVGFMRRDDVRAGASPDSLIGTDGGLEIKTRTKALQVELLLADRVPPEHIPQVQGNLWISMRDWWDFVSYSPGLPLFVKRVHRDELMIARIAQAVAEFNDELDALTARVQAMAA